MLGRNGPWTRTGCHESGSLRQEQGSGKEGKEYASTQSSCEPCSITIRWLLQTNGPPLLRAVTFRCAETTVTVIIQLVFESRPRPHRFLPRIPSLTYTKSSVYDDKYGRSNRAGIYLHSSRTITASLLLRRCARTAINKTFITVTHKSPR